MSSQELAFEYLTILTFEEKSGGSLLALQDREAHPSHLLEFGSIPLRAG